MTVDHRPAPDSTRSVQSRPTAGESIARRTWWLLAVATVLSIALAVFAALMWSVGVLPASALAAGLITFLIADRLDRDPDSKITPIRAIKEKASKIKAARAAKSTETAKTAKTAKGDESSTEKLLKGLARRGTKLATDIPFELRDIEHALIGPSGLVAVSTHHTNAEWEVTESGIVTRGAAKSFPVPGPVLAAKQSAQSLHALALSAGVNATVLPVAILWGSHIADIPTGSRTIDGVLVASGSQADEWTSLLTSTDLAPSQVKQVWSAANTRKSDHVDKPEKTTASEKVKEPVKADGAEQAEEASKAEKAEQVEKAEQAE